MTDRASVEVHVPYFKQHLHHYRTRTLKNKNLKKQNKTKQKKTLMSVLQDLPSWDKAK